MHWLNIPNTDSELHDLIRSTGKKVVYTVGGLYLAGHIVATVGFPNIFSPGIWAISLSMLAIIVLSLRFIERRYLLSQFIWLAGLTGVIVLAFFIYWRPEIIWLLRWACGTWLFR